MYDWKPKEDKPWSMIKRNLTVFSFYETGWTWEQLIDLEHRLWTLFLDFQFTWHAG